MNDALSIILVVSLYTALDGNLLPLDYPTACFITAMERMKTAKWKVDRKGKGAFLGGVNRDIGVFSERTMATSFFLLKGLPFRSA